MLISLSRRRSPVQIRSGAPSEGRRASKVAALYDIHGNLPALRAVLEEVDREDVDLIVVGGDVAAGPFPAETLRLLGSLGDRACFVRGNADRELVEAWDDHGGAPGEDLWALRTSWAAERIDQAQRDMLDSYVPTVEVELEALGVVLFCHGSPRRDDEIITALSPEDRLEPMLSAAPGVVVCGHTHVQFDRRVGERRVVNAGSVGLPYEGRPGAYWALLGPDVQLRRAPYDLESAAAEVRASAFPDPEEYLTLLVSPPSRDEASGYFESRAQET